MAFPLLHTKSQLQRLHEIQARPRIQRPSSCVQSQSPPQVVDVVDAVDPQSTLPHPTHPTHPTYQTIFNHPNQHVSSPASQAFNNSCASAPFCVVSPSLTGRSGSTPALNSGQPVIYTEPSCYPTKQSPVSPVNKVSTAQSHAQSQSHVGPHVSSALQGWQFQGCQYAQPLRLSTPSNSTADRAASSGSMDPPNRESYRADHYRQLKEDLDLAKRLKMELPDILVERIKRLHVQSSILEQLRLAETAEQAEPDEAGNSRLAPCAPNAPNAPSAPASPSVREARKPLEELHQAISAVKAEQGAMRRMQEEELLELCKVRNLLEREEKEKKEKEEKEREQELLSQIQLEKQAKEQQSRHDVALRVEQVLLSQGARREEFLQAELRQLDQEEKEVERRNMELKRQAEEMQEIVSGMSEGTSLWRSGHSAVSFTQQPKIAVETNPESAHGTARRAAFGANRVAFANEPAATTAALAPPPATTAALAPPLPTAPPRAANTETFPGTEASGTSMGPAAPVPPVLPSTVPLEPVTSQAPAPRLSPPRRDTPNSASKLLVGEGPLWQPPSTAACSQTCSKAWTEDEQQQQSLMQAYLAFINKEVESVPMLDPAWEGSSLEAGRGDPPRARRQFRRKGFEDLPQVYRAAISIVAQHGWSALHGGENAGACWTALHWAAAEGRTEICQLLLQCRADADHQDEMGRCPAYYASLHGHVDTLALLKQSVRHAQAARTSVEEEEGELMSVASTKASPFGERASTRCSTTPTHTSS